MTSTNGTRPPTNTIRLGKTELTVERATGLKASRAFALVRAVSSHVPDLVKAWGQFRSDYGETHYLELDRAQAMARYGPRPLVDEEDRPVRYPDGHERAGDVVMVPGPLESMTEEAWQSTDNKLRIKQAPTTGESIAAIFPEALDVAEDHVYRLLALFITDNAELKTAWREGSLDELLERQVNDVILEAYADELLELAVVAGEVIGDQFVRKTSELGERMGNALRLVGLNPATTRRQTPAEAPQTTSPERSSTPTTSPDTPSSSRPTSPSDGAESSDGQPTPPSTPPTTSSPPSPVGPSASEPG